MSNKGSIAFAVLLTLVFLALGAAILVRSMQENAAAKRLANSTTAMWVAEAGIQKLQYEYNNNSCHNMVQIGTNTACSSCTVCGGVSKTLSGTLSGYGDYDVTLNNAGDSVTSVGSVSSRTAAKMVQRTIQVSIGRPAIFGNGIFAQGQITISNNALVDSYNSNTGNYGGANILKHGNVGTNGVSSGIVTISNNGTVDGNVSTGPNGTVTQANNSVVTGSITHTNNVSLPAVVVPSSLTSLSSGGTLTMGNNGTQNVAAGDYKYSNLSFANNATLNINGNVRLYLTGASALSTGNNVILNVNNGASLTIYTDGTVNLANNITINNVSKKPSNFLIYSTYSGASTGVNLSNNGSSYVGVYAPTATVNISNNNGLYGSVVGKTVTLNNNGEVHYDEALSSMANPFESAIISNWQEI